MKVDFEYHYAPPTIRALSGARDDKVFSIALHSVDFHAAQVKSTLTLSSGSTKLLGIWKPEGAPEYDGKDVMQAAFLRVDVVSLGKE